MKRRLDDSGPQVGQVLVIEGGEWSVTDHSTSWDDGGYYVDEWECARGEEVAYLLKEQAEPPRWFFTRQVPVSSVRLPNGPALDAWLASAAAPKPPDRLVHNRRTYAHEEAAEATYEEEPGERTTKTTWEYWDAKRGWNLAVERWADGRVECYRGRYVRREAITLRGGATAGGWSGFAGACVLAAIVFGIMLIVGQPVDRGLAVALLIAAASGFGHALGTSPSVALPWLVATPILILAFLRFPAFTSAAGLGAILLVPAVITRWGVMRDAEGARSAGVRASFAAVAAAVLVGGLYHYFWFAPAPRTLGQYLLALGPAPLAGLLAALVARLVLKVSAEGVTSAPAQAR